MYDVSPGRLQRSRRRGSISLPSYGPSFQRWGKIITPVLRTRERVCKVMKNLGARENHSSLGPSVKALWGGIRSDTGVLGRKCVWDGLASFPRGTW